MVCNGSLARHEATHSGVGVQIEAAFTGFDDTRMLPRCSIMENENKKKKTFKLNIYRCNLSNPKST